MKYKDDTYQKGADNSMFSAMVAGFAMGAAAVFFAKKENRRMVQNRMNQLFEMGSEKMEDVHEKLDDLKSKAKSEVSRQAEKLQDNLEETQSRVKRATK